MAFDFLLLSALKPGQYSCSEKGKGFFIKPEQDEAVLLFDTDTDKFREHFQIKSPTTTGKVCDSLVFYKKSDTNLLFFIELKGSDIKTAIEQLENTVKTIENKMDKKGVKYSKIAIIIHNGGSPPRNIVEEQKRLKNQQQIVLKIQRCGTDKVNLREFLPK